MSLTVRLLLLASSRSRVLYARASKYIAGWSLLHIVHMNYSEFTLKPKYLWLAYLIWCIQIRIKGNNRSGTADAKSILSVENLYWILRKQKTKRSYLVQKTPTSAGSKRGSWYVVLPPIFERGGWYVAISQLTIFFNYFLKNSLYTFGCYPIKFKNWFQTSLEAKPLP